MNPNRMTVEELTELLKSGPVELECDDKHYKDQLFRIKVLAIHKTLLSYIDSEDEMQVNHTEILKHYPSKKSAPIVKRYWIWSIKDMSKWRKLESYYTETGVMTGGEKSTFGFETIIKLKHENEWIELDEKGELVNWSGKV